MDKLQAKDFKFGIAYPLAVFLFSTLLQLDLRFDLVQVRLIVNLTENDCGKTGGASNDKPVCQLNKNIVIVDNRMGKQSRRAT